MSEVAAVDVIVAGLGAHGRSAAYHLASRGASVLGFDRFARGHTLGSSGGLSRIIRLSYYEHPDYVPLLRRAWTLWRELERAGGEKLLTETGGLYAGAPDGELVAGALDRARRHELEHEVLDAAALRRRHPLFEWPDGWQGVFERQAGWLAPERSMETHLRLAEQDGAPLRFSEPIERWTSTAEGASVGSPADAPRERRVARCQGLHVHEHAGRPLHRRPPARPFERRRRVRMLGPRLQVLERDRRDPRRPRAHGRDAPPDRIPLGKTPRPRVNARARCLTYTIAEFKVLATP